jgi:hypothetical protein
VCCDFARHPPHKGFTDRLATLRAERAALERAVKHQLLDHYRRQRRMPAGPLPALLSRRERNRLIARGEWEHSIGLAKIIPWVRDAARRIAERLRPPRN